MKSIIFIDWSWGIPKNHEIFEIFVFSFDLVYPQLTPINTSLQISGTECPNGTGSPRNDPNGPYFESGAREPRKVMKYPKILFFHFHCNITVEFH